MPCAAPKVVRQEGEQKTRSQSDWGRDSEMPEHEQARPDAEQESAEKDEIGDETRFMRDRGQGLAGQISEIIDDDRVIAEIHDAGCAEVGIGQAPAGIHDRLDEEQAEVGIPAQTVIERHPKVGIPQVVHPAKDEQPGDTGRAVQSDRPDRASHRSWPLMAFVSARGPTGRRLSRDGPRNRERLSRDGPWNQCPRPHGLPNREMHTSHNPFTETAKALATPECLAAF